ncbi:ABC transporter ATP-binding protein [Atopococcus tabaci]|uniref:ABC transporter ATP-binding protein n=1 Tax=Atopococcus tabaci TaxID=269774 RepID=UPI0004065DDA|nr:ATP-binding cassette domain-containing protein [Atopococcus tabaci]
MTTTPSLQVTGLSKTFNRGTANENRVLKNLRFTAKEGDFITVIGGNGAGKSTLLNALSGSLTADTGRIILNGKDVTTQSEEKRARWVSRVFQDPLMGTAPRMTVAENLSLAMHRGEKRLFKRTLHDESRQHFHTLLKQTGLGLETRLDEEVGQLSGGQRQVIAMLMATLKRPELLLLDEHTAALDPKAADMVMKLTQKKVNEERLTTLMITHNMKHAIEYGNRLVMMQAGEIIVDMQGEEKNQLTVERLMQLFQSRTGGEELSDRMMLV